MPLATRIPVTISAIRLQTSFTVYDCATCGVLYAVTDEYDARRRFDGQSFYCPNGHSQSYTSEASRLRKRLEEAERNATRLLAEQDRLVAEKYELARDLKRSKREHKVVMRRITNGVCPCCQRTFQDVLAHMQRKHPDQVVTAEQAIAE